MAWGTSPVLDSADTGGPDSGWVVSTPVSSTATTTDGLPWVTSHAARAPIWAGPHWTVPLHDDRHGSSG